MPSRHHVQGLAAAAVACAIAAWPAQAPANDEYDNEARPALLLYAHGGAFSPLAHLDQEDDVEFKTGFNLGGGNFMFARAEARDAGYGTIRSISGDKFNRYPTTATCRSVTR